MSAGWRQRTHFTCYFLFPDRLLVGSTIVNVEFGFRVGGKGSPLTQVTSCLVIPPRGPTSAYCPEAGTFCPDLNCLDISLFPFLRQMEDLYLFGTDNPI